jgi:multiple sugar transport system substrate-binding protein
MARINRRRLLKISGAGALVARSCGCATMFALGRAPAHAQRPNLHWLRGADFVPASDRLLKTTLTAECEKALGIKLTIETINLNDMQARNLGDRHAKTIQFKPGPKPTTVEDWVQGGARP